MAFAGGIGNLYGSILGAFALTIVEEYSQEFGQYNVLVYGLMLAIVILFLPKGLVDLPNKLKLRKARRVMLSVNNVTLAFGGVKALSDVSVSIPPGSISGLIGPNDAGKTSLFNVVSGIYAPTLQAQSASMARRSVGSNCIR